MAIVGVNSLFEVRVFGTYLGVSMQNVFWYLGLFVPDTILAVTVQASFEAEVAVSWEGTVNAEWDGDRITIDEVTSVQNFLDASTSIGPGLVVGDAMAPHACVGLRMLRETKATRSGWKRIAGVTETQITEGKLVAGGLTTFGTLLTDFRTDLVVGAETVEPVIVRKTFTGEPPVLDPPSSWIYNTIGGGIVLEDLTTQNSRKFSR